MRGCAHTGVCVQGERYHGKGWQQHTGGVEMGEGGRIRGFRYRGGRIGKGASVLSVRRLEVEPLPKRLREGP